LGIGFVAGLRALVTPAVVAWVAHLGWLNLNNSPLAFMGSIITVVIFSLLAVFEVSQRFTAADAETNQRLSR
jgi:uncharacterized membrane protein